MSFASIGLFLGASAATATATGAAATAIAAGTAASLYGANKQGQIQKDTNAANQASVDKTNNLEWSNYLMQRGVSPGAGVATGTMPSSFTPVNTRLPLWANVNVPQPSASLPAPKTNVPLFVKRGGSPQSSQPTAPAASPEPTYFIPPQPVVPNVSHY